MAKINIEMRCLKCKFCGNFHEQKPGIVRNQIIPKISLLVVLFLKMASAKDKNSSIRVYSEYEEICKILNIWKIANMVFLVDETCAKLTFLPLGATLCRPKSIITAQIHVKLILPHIILARVIVQPILDTNRLWIIKI